MLRQYIQLIPTNPRLVPDPSACLEAVELLSKSLGDGADSTCGLSDYPKFYSRAFNGDGNTSFDSVRCPHCHNQLDSEWWNSAMNQSWKSKHDKLEAVVPCCATEVSLNNLLYEPQAGFARFCIGAYASAPLQIDLVQSLEKCLDFELRQIWAEQE